MGILDEVMAKAGYVKREDLIAELAKEVNASNTAESTPTQTPPASETPPATPATPTPTPEGAGAVQTPQTPSADVVTPPNPTPPTAPPPAPAAQPRNALGQYQSPAAPPATTQTTTLPNTEKPQSVADLSALVDMNDREKLRTGINNMGEKELNRLLAGLEVE